MLGYRRIEMVNLYSCRYDTTALDAKAANIDIFLDIEKFSLQVNDDGVGIQNLSRIAQRHGEFESTCCVTLAQCRTKVTSKCHTLSDMKQLKTYGYRGEGMEFWCLLKPDTVLTFFCLTALAAIVNESLTQIITRHYLSSDTFEGFWRV